MSLQPEVRRRVEELAAELRQLLYGPTGTPEWGTEFTVLEDEACEVGDEVTRCLMSQALQEQAERAAAAPTAACVVCGRDSPSDDHAVGRSAEARHRAARGANAPRRRDMA